MNGMYGMGQPMQQMPDQNQPQQPLGGIPAGGDARARMLAEMLMKQGQGGDTIAGGLNNAMKSYLMMKYGMNGQQAPAQPASGGGMLDGIGSIFSKLGGMFGGGGGGAFGATGEHSVISGDNGMAGGGT